MAVYDVSEEPVTIDRHHQVIVSFMLLVISALGSVEYQGCYRKVVMIHASNVPAMEPGSPRNSFLKSQL